MNRDYRTEPVWKNARQLALALSFATDAFPRRNQAQALAKTIQRESVDLLVWIVRVYETPSAADGAERCIQSIAEALHEGTRKSFISQTDTVQLTRDLKAVSAALQDLHNGGGGGTGTDFDSNPRILKSSLSSGAIYD